MLRYLYSRLDAEAISLDLFFFLHAHAINKLIERFGLNDKWVCLLYTHAKEGLAKLIMNMKKRHTLPGILNSLKHRNWPIS